jgi:hypothetical protein
MSKRFRELLSDERHSTISFQLERFNNYTRGRSKGEGREAPMPQAQFLGRSENEKFAFHVRNYDVIYFIYKNFNVLCTSRSIAGNNIK